jgi:sodium/proline symporter
MPHILVRYLSIKSEHEMRKSQIIGCSWIVLILAMSAVVGLIGRQFLGEIDNENLVFVHMVRRLFPAFISGVLLSAILAAAMSTADSQLLASSSAFASDIYKPVIRKDATDHEMQWAGRVIVMLISVVAFFIAASPNCGGIMALVECAWAGFGSAFGPVILLSLYWRRLTYSGAIAGVCVGFVVDAVWYAFLSSSTGLYEIIPGFLCGLLAAVIVSLCSKAPSKEVTDLFDRAFEPTD